MSLVTRLEPIDRDIALLIEDVRSPAKQSARLAAFAREKRDEARAINARSLGREAPFETFVDGRSGADEATVRPTGVVVYEFELIGELFAWIDQQLVKHAPVLTGEFSRSFVFFADGVEAQPNGAAPAASEYVFTNFQPYTRKLERGQSAQAPDGVFEAVAALASRRFGNVARIRFGYRSVPAGAVGAWASTTRMQSKAASRNRPGAQRRDWLTRQPAIVITMGR